MQLKRRISTTRLGAWLNLGLKKISLIEEEHSSSLYALLRTILGQSQSWLLTHSEYILDPKEEASLNISLSRLLSGEPLAYITGTQSFFGREFFVNPDVLIPRPETELLVGEAINKIHSYDGRPLIADVGTGSGCIAVSLANAIEQSEIMATDVSFNALKVAQRNSQNHMVEDRIHLIQAFLLDGIEEKFDLICANLPYIPTNKLKSLPICKYEPWIALDGGAEGLTLITHFLENIHCKIQPNGTIILEIEYTQKQSILDICTKLFSTASCTILEDLAGLPRVAIINFMD